MERHVFIVAPKYMIIIKHVPNTNTRGVNGFSVICKVGLFRMKKKRDFRGSMDFSAGA